MRHAVILILFLGIAGCASNREPQFGKNDPAAYHYQMGLSYLAERNFTSALFELTEAEKLDPDNPELLYNLGLAYIGKRRPDLAEKPLQKTLLLKPNNSRPAMTWVLPILSSNSGTAPSSSSSS